MCGMPYELTLLGKYCMHTRCQQQTNNIRHHKEQQQQQQRQQTITIDIFTSYCFYDCILVDCPTGASAFTVMFAVGFVSCLVFPVLSAVSPPLPPLRARGIVSALRAYLKFFAVYCIADIVEGSCERKSLYNLITSTPEDFQP